LKNYELQIVVSASPMIKIIAEGNTKIDNL